MKIRTTTVRSGSKLLETKKKKRNCVFQKYLTSKTYFTPLFERTIWVHVFFSVFYCFITVFFLFFIFIFFCFFSVYYSFLFYSGTGSGPNLIFLVQIFPPFFHCCVYPTPSAHTMLYSLCSYPNISCSFTFNDNNICHFIPIMIYSPWWHHSHLIKYNLSVIYSETPSKIYSVEKYYL